MFNKTLNQTLIVITHDERIALQADRILTIEDGRITKDEVIRDEYCKQIDTETAQTE